VRLSSRQWIAVALIVLVTFALAPSVWQRAEPLPAGADERIPYDLSNDYWLFGRYAAQAGERGDTLLVGDSVIWGEYVTKHETLSHYLNAQPSAARFANLGADGTHPVALAGLIEYYGGDIARRSVVLHCNLLWTASKKHDLQTEKEFRFNHPQLVPQFVPRIPCYGEPYSRRLSIAIEREIPFFAWANHVRLAYFGKGDLPAWTMEHPYGDPMAALRPNMDRPEGSPAHEPISWTARGIEKQSLAWVDLDTSLQWRYFRRTVELLRARGNRVFVVVGPFNEHMLEEKSRETYGDRRRAVEAWLEGQGIPHFAPALLPSELYADASHPLAGGYAQLAQQLLANEAFVRFLGGAAGR
jgi:hypothetical protein